MGTLDIAARVAEHWTRDRRPARDELANYFNGILEGYEEAIRIWQDYIDADPQTPITGSRWTIINWIGSERAHKLWTVNRRINDYFGRIASLTGAELPWSFPTDEVMIDIADKQLVHVEDETGVNAARGAIERIRERIAHTQALLEEIRAG